jgi:hypothetical protein
MPSILPAGAVTVLQSDPLNHGALELIQIALTSYARGGYLIRRQDIPKMNRIKYAEWVGASQPVIPSLLPTGAAATEAAFKNTSTSTNPTPNVVSPVFQLFSRSTLGYEEQTLADLLGATTVVGTDATTDQSAAPVNSTEIAAAALVSAVVAASGALVIAAQPDVPRNVVITIFNDSAGSLNLFVGTTAFLVTGTYQGETISELISFTSTSGNDAVGHTPNYRFAAGVLVYDTITSIVMQAYGTNAPASTMKISAGVGSVIGIPQEIAASGSVYKVTVNDVDKTGTVTINATNSTVDVGTIANGAYITLTYQPDAELPNGTLPSTLYLYLKVRTDR